MTHKDGMRLPESLVSTPLAQAGWVASYNRAAEAIPIAAGGTEPRYRLWGSYSLDERPADVLGRMLGCSDGRLVPTPDGGLTLDIGAWSEPTVILTADAITGFSDVGRGRDVMTLTRSGRRSSIQTKIIRHQTPTHGPMKPMFRNVAKKPGRSVQYGSIAQPSTATDEARMVPCKSELGGDVQYKFDGPCCIR